MGIRKWIENMIWKYKAEEEFRLKLDNSDTTDAFVKQCIEAYSGSPYWADGEDVRTINIAETICAETARLTTLNIGIDIRGSARGDYLNEQMAKLMPKLREWTEFGCACGQVIFKPNGYSTDILFPDEFIITDTIGDEITGIIFIDDYYEAKDELWFSRLEYHRIEGGRYLISNKCYVGKAKGDFGRRIDIKKTRWSLLTDEIVAQGVDKMLFGYFKLPMANNINPKSYNALPIFANAMEELSDADVAYSRMTKEIWQSKRTVLLDSDRLMEEGTRVGGVSKAAMVSNAGLPSYVKLINGTGQGDIYHEINPTLNTDIRITGLNNLLSQIGFKCGFSNGYFVFNEKTGMITATQVEADDRRTIQLIADVRKQLESSLDGLIYALDRFADAYDLAPRGSYEVAYDMADITENHEEDKARWLAYAQMGYIPFWYYLTKYEGFSEEEAKEIAIDPMATAQLGLFAPQTE